MRSRGPLGLVLLAACLQALFLLPLFNEGEPFGSDLSIHLAESAGIARALSAGDLQLWNDMANGGFASGYYYQLLPQLAVALLHILGLGLLTAFKLCLAGTLILFPLSVYQGLKIAYEDPLAAALAAVFASAIFSRHEWGLGADSLFTNGLYTQSFSTLFYPLALGFGHRFLETGKGCGGAVLFGLLTGLSHPFFGVALLFVFLARALMAPRRFPYRRALSLLGLTLLLSAFFWAPILVHYTEFGGFPARTQGEDGLPPSIFLQDLFTGALLDDERLPVLTALFFLCCVRASKIHRSGWWLAQSALFSLLLMAGPLLRTPDDLIPAIRFLGPLQLCMAVAAGLVAADFLGRMFEGSKLQTLGALSLGALLLILWSSSAQRTEARAQTVNGNLFQRDELQSIIQALKSSPYGRIALNTSMPSHWWMYLPAAYAAKPALVAYGGAALQSSKNFAHLRSGGPHLEDFAVRYVMQRSTKAPPTGAKLRIRTATHALYERPVSLLKLPSGETLDERSAPSSFEAKVSLKQTGNIIFRTTYHPGWRAWLDGKSVTISPTTRPRFMRISAPEGEHTLRFAFVRPWWTWGLLLLDALLLLALLKWNPVLFAEV